MPLRLWSVGSVCLLCVACGSDRNQVEDDSSWLEEPQREFPQRLSEVGLWDLSQPRDLWSAQTSGAALSFAPRFPLWTNGARKQRQLVLPEGATIDATDPEHWRVPAGSIAFKTLYFADEAGAPVPAETRIIRIDETGERRFAVYVWDEARDEAVRTAVGATLSAVDFSGARLEHRVPSENECAACHDSSPQTFLGLNGVQQQPGDSGVLPSRAFAAPLSAPSPNLRGDDLDTRVLGYFFANCSHCHNGWSGPNSEFSLLPDAAFANLIDVESQGSASTAGVRVIPGDPEDSLLVHAMDSVQGERSAKPMPPLGVQQEDAEGVALIEHWIEQLEHDD
ncbi:MAG: hypothetical protein KC766_11380 [Myxococcales bacterium]|nr:hypothetical protein [Myxococcales bacterium]